MLKYLTGTLISIKQACQIALPFGVVDCGVLAKKKIASVIGIVPEDILNDIQRMVLECFDRV